MGKSGLLKWKKLIQDGAQALGIHVNTRQAELFEIHREELLLWNRKTNLTAITDPFEIAVKHFLDSIAAAPLIPPGSKLLDIGSGAGFPGIPLKTMLPSNSVMLIEASRKKAAFLQHLIRRLKLTDISALHCRAEDLVKNPDYTHYFNVITCRALGDLKTFVQIAYPLLAHNGFLLAYKANLTASEIQQIRNPDSPITDLAVSTETYRLPLINHIRTLVIVRLSQPLPEGEEFSGRH